MNENKPNWADKANLASNVLRNIQLQEVHSTLRALGDLQAQKIQLELNERQAQEREDRVRDHIWHMEQAFEKVLQDLDLTPCAVHILAKQVLDGMARYKVSTTSFRQFSDKDRVGAFIHKLQQSIEESKTKMSPGQRDDTEKFLSYQAESQKLAQSIEVVRTGEKERTNKLEQAKKRKEVASSKLGELRLKAGTPEAMAEQKDATRRSAMSKVVLLIMAVPTGMAWLSLLIFLGAPIYNFFTDGNSVGDGKLFAIGLGVLLVAIVLTGICAALCDQSRVPKSIEEKIALREKEIRDADAAITKLNQLGPPHNDLAKFKAKDLTELVKRQNEHETFLLQFRQANHLPLEDPFPRDIETQQGGRSGRALHPEMSPEVQVLARCADKKIAAIKLYREQTGVGLAEAKEAVEAFFEQVHSGDR